METNADEENNSRLYAAHRGYTLAARMSEVVGGRPVKHCRQLV